MEMEIIQCYQTKNPCYRKGTPMKPVGIVVHSTGANNPHLCRYVDCPERLGVNRYGNHWNRPEAATLVHGAIGLDKEGFVTVVNTLPYTMAAWGVGKGSRGSYNYDPTGHIQFEMCEDDLTDPSYFDQVMGTAVAYCAQLCREYGLAAESIVSHKEAHAQGYASNHGDPENWMGRFGMTMEDFRARVRAKLKGEVTIMGKVVNRDELVAWIDAHAVEVEKQPEPEVKPEPVAIKAGDKVVFKSGVTQWGTGSGNKGIPSWAQGGKTTFTVLEIVKDGTEARIGNASGAYTGTAYLKDLEKVG
nr:MAG TPA: PGRP protein [Caudoviricetes sp.]